MSKEAIDKARAEVNAGWLNSDADAIVAHATEDIKMLGPHEPMVDGKEAARTAVKALRLAAATRRYVERISYHLEQLEACWLNRECRLVAVRGIPALERTPRLCQNRIAESTVDGTPCWRYGSQA
jgi:hypothetical protein